MTSGCAVFFLAFVDVSSLLICTCIQPNFGAIDARVGESVLMTSYVKETDEQLRQASNRTFARLLASLPVDLARRCGHVAGYAL